ISRLLHTCGPQSKKLHCMALSTKKWITCFTTHYVKHFQDHRRSLRVVCLVSIDKRKVQHMTSSWNMSRSTILKCGSRITRKPKPTLITCGRLGTVSSSRGTRCAGIEQKLNPLESVSLWKPWIC